MDLTNKWYRILFGVVVILVVAGLIALVQRSFKLASGVLNVVVTILDHAL